MTPEERAWIASLESRHFADLRFAEVSRALRALSSTYVERRGRLRGGAALDGVGKRAAFALFYGPLHFLIVRHIVSSVDRSGRAPRTLVDLGCGTGAAGAAWAASCAKPPSVFGVDRHPWAVEQARQTYRTFGLRARTEMGNLITISWPADAAVLVAYTANELSADARGALLTRLLTHARRGNRVLVVEPIARSVAPWWKAWQSAFESAGGRSDEWRARIPLPNIVEKLDRAAGLDHSELTARSLWIAGG